MTEFLNRLLVCTFNLHLHHEILIAEHLNSCFYCNFIAKSRGRPKGKKWHRNQSPHDKILSGLLLIPLPSGSTMSEGLICLNINIKWYIFFLCSFLSHGDSYRSLANRFRISPAKGPSSSEKNMSGYYRSTHLQLKWLHLQGRDWIQIEKEF